MAKITTTAKEVLEKAVAKKYVKNWEYFDYINFLLKQKILKYQGKPITKIISMTVGETTESTELNFLIGSVRYKATLSNLTMPLEVRSLLHKSMEVMLFG